MAYFGVVLGLKYLSAPYISPLGRVKIPSQKKPEVKRYYKKFPITVTNIYVCFVLPKQKANIKISKYKNV